MHRMAVQRAVPPYTRLMREHDLELLELPAVLARLAGAAASEPGALLAESLRPSADAGRGAPAPATDHGGDRTARRRCRAGSRWRRRRDRRSRAGRTRQHPRHQKPLADRADDPGRHGRRRALDRRATTSPRCTSSPPASTSRCSQSPRRSDARSRKTVPTCRDSASPVLRRLRRELREGRGKLAERLRKIARDPALAEHLQDDFVTERGGRPVLALKASARGRVPGIVHDSSGSGQTLFVEPLAAVEDSNRLREAEVAERDEVARILRNLSSLVAGQAEPLIVLVRGDRRARLVIARGTLSRGWRGALVTPSSDVLLRGARHPLLEKASAVPIDLELGSLRALVISGPNTGGKTVALKTLGLAVALYQSGVRPPADEASLPVFDEILVDIGDEQSIAMSLSTFSAHLRNLVGILERATAESLVLLDEIAAGTDPVEGAALAEALLDRLATPGATDRDDEPLRRAEGMGERCRRRRERRHRDRSGDERAAVHGGRSADRGPPTRCTRRNGSACPRRSSLQRATGSRRSGCRSPSSWPRPRRPRERRRRRWRLRPPSGRRQRRRGSRRSAPPRAPPGRDRAGAGVGGRGAPACAGPGRDGAGSGCGQSSRSCGPRSARRGSSSGSAAAPRPRRPRRRRPSATAGSVRPRIAPRARPASLSRLDEPLPLTAPLAAGDPVVAPDSASEARSPRSSADEATVLGRGGLRVRVPLDRLRPIATSRRPISRPNPP